MYPQCSACEYAIKKSKISSCCLLTSSYFEELQPNEPCKLPALIIQKVQQLLTGYKQNQQSRTICLTSCYVCHQINPELISKWQTDIMACPCDLSNISKAEHIIRLTKYLKERGHNG